MVTSLPIRKLSIVLRLPPWLRGSGPSFLMTALPSTIPLQPVAALCLNVATKDPASSKNHLKRDISIQHFHRHSSFMLITQLFSTLAPDIETYTLHIAAPRVTLTITQLWRLERGRRGTGENVKVEAEAVSDQRESDQ